jgi:hypothetical protein
MTTVADTILKQLGGNRFIAMTGAKHLCKWNEGSTLYFELPPNKTKAKVFMITLTVWDVYKIEVFKKSTLKAQVIQGKPALIQVKEIDGVYCDQLKETIEDLTGFYLTL